MYCIKATKSVKSVKSVNRQKTVNKRDLPIDKTYQQTKPANKQNLNSIHTIIILFHRIQPLFKSYRGLERKNKFWRNKHTLLCSRINNYTFHFLFNLECAKALKRSSLTILQFGREDISKRCHQLSGILIGIS